MRTENIASKNGCYNCGIDKVYKQKRKSLLGGSQSVSVVICCSNSLVSTPRKALQLPFSMF